jgi:hypothetical protein
MPRLSGVWCRIPVQWTARPLSPGPRNVDLGLGIGVALLDVDALAGLGAHLQGRVYVWRLALEGRREGGRGRGGGNE